MIFISKSFEYENNKHLITINMIILKEISFQVLTDSKQIWISFVSALLWRKQFVTLLHRERERGSSFNAPRGWRREKEEKFAERRLQRGCDVINDNPHHQQK